jgi:hypothetical protein
VTTISYERSFSRYMQGGATLSYSREQVLHMMGHEILPLLGYDRSQIVVGFNFTSEDAGLVEADMVAFGDEYRHDLSTACIAVQWYSDDGNSRDILSNLRYLAPPIGILAGPETVSIFPVREKPEIRPLVDLRYEDVKGYFATNRLNFSAEVLMASKRGHQQLYLFDLDRSLTEFAENASRRLLVERFEESVYAGLKRTGVPSEEVNSALIRSTIRLLAARVLEDKGTINGRSITALELLTKAKRVFPDYFNIEDVAYLGWDVADEMLDSLTRGVTYRAFSNELLGYLYENALLDREDQKDSGVYYTPRYLAEGILERMPLEDIPEDERFVMDGTCGSGNLLLASYDRLKRLLPAEMGPLDRHKYLTEHIWGIDKDEFASEAARLALLLFSLPLGNSWNIHAADFLKDNCMGFYPSRPRVIVGNPPFKHYRGEGQVNQVAKRFLDRYLDHLADGGLMGIILPETILSNDDCADIRARVLKETEVLEVWHLHGGAVPSSDAELAVLILRKKAPSPHRPIRIRRVVGRVGDRKRFESSLETTYDYVFPGTAVWEKRPELGMASSHLADIWTKLSEYCDTIDDQVLDIANGIQLYGSPKDVVSADNVPGFKPWLPGSSTLAPYCIPDSHWFLDYDRVRWGRREYQWLFDLKEKIIINGRRARRHPWRAYAAVDRMGLYPNEALHVAAPKEGVPVEELAAVINHPVINAWLDSFNLSRTLKIPTLRAAPYPNITPELRSAIVTEVRTLEALHKEWWDRRSDIRVHVRKLDHLIYQGYGLSDHDVERIEQSFIECPRPGAEWKGHEFVAKRENSVPIRGCFNPPWRVDGEVMNVNATNATIALRISGVNDDQPFWIEIPRSIPGWALGKGVLFKAEIPLEMLDAEAIPPWALRKLEPLELSYVPLARLAETIRKRVDHQEHIQ